MAKFTNTIRVLAQSVEQKMQDEELESYAESLIEGWALYRLVDLELNTDWLQDTVMRKLLRPLTLKPDSQDDIVTAIERDGLIDEIIQMRVDIHSTELATLQELYLTYFDRVPQGLKLCRRFRISVSDISIILGISPYDCVRTFETLVRTNNPESYSEEDEVLEYNVLVREGDEIFTSDGVRVPALPANAVPASSLREKPKYGTVMYVDMQDDLTEQMRLITLHAGTETSKMVNTAAGCAGESETYNLYESKTGKRIAKRQVRKSITRNGLRITGVVDGIADDCIVEIKNRMKTFKGVNPWDRCQLQFYMWMHGLQSGYLVERIAESLKIHTVAFDRDFIDRALEQLDRFLPRYYRFLELHVEHYNKVRNRNRYLKEHLFMQGEAKIA